MQKRTYHLNLLDIENEVICTISRNSYLSRHAFLATTQAKVRRGRFGRYVNKAVFNKSLTRTAQIPAFLQRQAD